MPGLLAAALEGLPPEVTFSREEQDYGIHNGLVETSLMLHLCPDLVRTQHATDFRSAWLAHERTMSMLTPEGCVGLGRETQDLNPAGALGNAGAATAGIGKLILDHQAGRLTQLLREVGALDLDSWILDGSQITPVYCP